MTTSDSGEPLSLDKGRTDPSPTTDSTGIPVTSAYPAGDVTSAPPATRPTVPVDWTPTAEDATAGSSVPATAPAAGTPSAELPADSPAPRRGLRMRTVVFGLALLLVAGLALMVGFTDADVDPGIVAVCALIGAGALLLLGAVRHREPAS